MIVFVIAVGIWEDKSFYAIYLTFHIFLFKFVNNLKIYF